MATKAGLLYSKEIEQELIEVGQSIPFESSSPFVKNSHLHIMTQAFQTGGHTRVCERWIEFSRNNEMHSILMTEQRNDPIPKSLERVVNEKRGSIYTLNSSPLVKIKEIREIASNYEKVILHIHADDQVTFIAFATTNFKRPVLFFNHLDHVFWIGTAISDLVINLRTTAVEQSIKYRSVQKNIFLPLPIKTRGLNSKKKIASLKNKLKISQDSRVVVTLASSEKYTPIKGYDFVKDFIEILKKYKDLHLIAIGPSPTEKRWMIAQEITGNRMKAIGRIPHEELFDYLFLADFAIDSYPMPSFTALLDTASCGIPCVSLVTPFGSMDCVQKSDSLCLNKEMLYDQITKIFDSRIQNNLFQKVKESHFKEPFLYYLDKVKKESPNYHELTDEISYEVKGISEANRFYIKIQLKKKYMKGFLKVFTTKLKLYLRI
ncbi:MAG: hypothetical protein ACJZ72_02110 [Opitutales bacterium]